LRKKSILIITDGIGYSSKEEFNAFHHANTPTYDHFFKNYPYSMIQTHGLSVGLPEGQMGNSEVGHMTIGSGRVLYSDLVKITKSLEDNNFQDQEAFKVVAKRERVHLIGLLSDGGVHSHIEHLFGIINILKSQKKEIIVHIITDGRDVSPTSSPKYISQLIEKFGNSITIGSISGRFYTMDRDKRWERVEKGFRSIVDAEPKTDLTPLQYVEKSYKNEIKDEFIEPTAFSTYDGFKGGDGVLFYNFRSDRMREIVTAIGKRDFSEFQKRDLEDLSIVTMTKYSEDTPFPIIFEKESPRNTLSETVSKLGLNQFHTAETEKYAHVTFFLNGGVEEPFLNETRVLIDSPKVKTYDMKPSMSAEAVTDAVLNAVDSDLDLIIVNYANGDMVGHTGVFEAGVEAVETVDRELGRVYKKAKDSGYSIILTSDHGNCEDMRDRDGNTLTNHTVGDVWCFAIDDEVKTLKDGGLNNIAPTLLKMMNLEIPKEMDEPLF
jgi:2,3-bisphosphoglycerate-independent phosphoglycerate mutase